MGSQMTTASLCGSSDGSGRRPGHRHLQTTKILGIRISACYKMWRAYNRFRREGKRAAGAADLNIVNCGVNRYGGGEEAKGEGGGKEHLDCQRRSELMNE